MRGTRITRFQLAPALARAGRRTAIILAACPCGIVHAHDAPTQWTYPPACCHGDRESGECQNIPARTVHVRPGGWAVVLMPGDHRKVTRQQRYFIPYGNEIPSRDGDYHICLHPTEKDENCFFVPPDSM